MEDVISSSTNSILDCLIKSTLTTGEGGSKPGD
uniref:Uncharacterized protein n=1 Tax=Anguilla anguilla TaxID=7936 RepID=A0A0E9TRZ3_ANGAN